MSVRAGGGLQISGSLFNNRLETRSLLVSESCRGLAATCWHVHHRESALVCWPACDEVKHCNFHASLLKSCRPSTSYDFCSVSLHSLALDFHSNLHLQTRHLRVIKIIRDGFKFLLVSVFLHRCQTSPIRGIG
jgi:hypothetical protein